MDTYHMDLSESCVCPWGHHLGSHCALTGHVHTRQLSPEFWLRPCSSIWKCFFALSSLGVNSQMYSLWKKKRTPKHSAGSSFSHMMKIREVSPEAPFSGWKKYSKTVNAAAWLQTTTLPNRTCFHLATLKDKHVAMHTVFCVCVMYILLDSKRPK